MFAPKIKPLLTSGSMSSLTIDDVFILYIFLKMLKTWGDVVKENCQDDVCAMSHFFWLSMSHSQVYIPAQWQQCFNDYRYSVMMCAQLLQSYCATDCNFHIFPLISQLQLFLGLMYKGSVIVLSSQNIGRGLSIKYNYSYSPVMTSSQTVKQNMYSTYCKRSMVLSNTNRYVIGKNFQIALRVLAWEIVKKAVLFCTSDLLCKTVIVHI